MRRYAPAINAPQFIISRCERRNLAQVVPMQGYAPLRMAAMELHPGKSPTDSKPGPVPLSSRACHCHRFVVSKKQHGCYD